jgi:hypothetical protein
MPPAYREAWLDPESQLVSFGKDGMRRVDHKWEAQQELGTPEAEGGCAAAAEKLCEAGTAAEGSTAAVRELHKATAEPRGQSNELVVVALGRHTAQPHCHVGLCGPTCAGMCGANASQHPVTGINPWHQHKSL